MVVPLGWMLDDRREAVPRLFKTREEPAAAPREKRRRVRSGGDETGALQLDIPLPLEEESVAEPVLGAEPDPVVESVPAVEAPSAAEVTPWEPSFDTTSDRAGLGEARSPLLSRAFGRRSNRDTDEAPDGDGESSGAG